jgi:hypothetical protein
MGVKNSKGYFLLYSVGRRQTKVGVSNGNSLAFHLPQRKFLFR